MTGPEIIAIASGKGGTGKTHIASSLAYLLQSTGLRTLMIDTDTGTDGLSLFVLGEDGTKQIDQFDEKQTFRGIVESWNGKKISYDIGKVNRLRDHGLRYPIILSGGKGIYGDKKLVSDQDSVPRVGQENFRKLLKALFDDLRLREFEFEIEGTEKTEMKRFDYIILDTRGGFSFESTDVCALADSFIIVTEAQYTSFYQDRNLVNKINAAANIIGKKTFLRAIIVNKAIEGEEKDFRLTLEKEYDIDYDDTYSFPLDLEAMMAYKTHKVPIKEYPGSEFASAAVFAFSNIMRHITAPWSTKIINKWNDQIDVVEKAYAKKLKKESWISNRLLILWLTLGLLLIGASAYFGYEYFNQRKVRNDIYTLFDTSTPSFNRISSLSSLYNKGYTYFNGLDLSGLDLSGIDLSGIECKNCLFTNANLSNVDLSNSNLQGADFQGADVTNTNFSNTIMDVPDLKQGVLPDNSPIDVDSEKKGN